MFPILYESIMAGSVPQHNGLGTLSPISCVVEQARNDIYELTMEYSSSGIHASEIALRRIIKVKPNFTDNPQLFRIDRIGKEMNGVFTVYAKHISYDLAGYPITSGTANNAASACLLLENATSGWSITTDKTVSANFAITTPASVKSYFVGREGSFLDVFGTAEIKYDNFNVQFLLHAGQNRGVKILYGKNLLELSQEMDCSNLYTHVVAFYKKEDTVITGDEVSTELTMDVPHKLVIDVSSEFEETPSVADLTAKAQAYINSHNLTVPSNNITLDFVQIGQLKDGVDLCDTVSVYYQALGITAEVKCIRTKWDCIRERYIETEFGDAKQTLADTITSDTVAISDATANANEAINIADSKKRVFISTPVPPYDEGDLWILDGAVYYCIEGKTSSEAYSEDDWSLATDYVNASVLENAITHATELITGNAGGYVVIRDTNADEQPDEILIMNTPSIETATQIWRWNKNGLGFATSYASSNYALALTADGQINASRILTGELDASRVTIQNLTANMFAGGKIQLGGYNNYDGVFELYNAGGTLIGQMDKNGVKFYGSGSGSNRPYVLFNNDVGFAGFAADGTKQFWVDRDEFHMKKCVAENEIQACGKIKFLPITTYDTNNNIINDGVAVVGV